MSHILLLCFANKLKEERKPNQKNRTKFEEQEEE